MLKTTKEETPPGVMDEEVWKAQQNDKEVQEIYQRILEDGDKITNSAIKLTITENKIYCVVQL